MGGRVPEELNHRVDHLADVVEALRKVVEEQTEELREANERRKKDRRRLLREVAVVMLAALVVLAIPIMVNRVAVNHARDDARQNSRAIQVLLYTQCTDRNATTTRQNVLIDRAIAAEKRRPKPNPATLKSLKDFKGTLSDCGAKP